MSISPGEAHLAPAQGDVVRSAGSSLVERSEGLGRAAVMEEVLGPHLDAMLRPIYEAGIDAQASRLPSLEGEFPLRILEHFSERLRYILQSRFSTLVKGSEPYRQFLELSEQRPDLLFYADDPSQNISEAIGTSIAVPLTVASSISGLEKPKEPGGYPLRDVEGLAEIMERESFHRILLRLTKGPNEFLGKGSDKFTEHGISRFYSLSLGVDHRMQDRLSVRDAFDVERGTVVGLSDAYAIAAERRRQGLRLRAPTLHQGNDSSGCPVRHGFEDAHGNPQPPLVLTGSSFVVAALRHAEQIPFRK